MHGREMTGHEWDASEEAPARGAEGAADPLLRDAVIQWTLTQLHRASVLARSCGRPTAEFALHVDELSVRGVTSAELKWLMNKGLIVPSIPAAGNAHDPRLEGSTEFAFRGESRFCLTAEGERIATAFLAAEGGAANAACIDGARRGPAKGRLAERIARRGRGGTNSGMSCGSDRV